MAYGTAAGVAALSPTWTRNGAFYDAGPSDTATNPTLTQVNGWLTQVSNLMDSALADEGFVVPITVTKVVSVLDLYVEGIVNDLVNYARKAGRFYSKRALDGGSSPFNTISDEIHAWVKSKAQGFENMGCELDPDVMPRSRATFDLL